LRPKTPPTPLLITGLAALALAATAATVWASATSTVHEDPALAAVVRGPLTASWALVGLATWERRPHSPLGPLITAAALVLAFTGLTALETPALFTLGAVAWPVQIILVAAVVLSFPDGRMRPAARLVIVGTAASSIGLWGLLLVGAASVPTVPGPNRCVENCPSNPFAFLDFSASLTDALERGAVLALSLVGVAVGAGIVARWHAATPTWRRTVWPVIVVLLAIAGTFMLATALRATLGEDDDVAAAAAWAPPLVSVAFPVAMLVVQSRARLVAAGSLRDMVGRLSPGTTHRDLEATMAAALGDPSLRLVFWVPQAGYVGLSGTPVDVTDPAMTLTEIRNGDTSVAAILHDPILEQPVPGVVQDAGAAVLLALENARLEAEIRTTERALRESRARIVAAGMHERRRLERDLHDTAQQRLVMLRLKLDLAEGHVPEDVHAMLERLGRDVDETIRGLREVGHGLYPPLLAEQGLVSALRAELRTDGPASLMASGEVGRSRPELETAVYLSCREALAVLDEEAGKEADVTLELETRRRWLRINLSGTTPAAAPGLADRVAERMRDPVAALGGRADAAGVNSGRWSVTAYVPWPPPADEP
jgi:signal transduction histidine kinase